MHWDSLVPAMLCVPGSLRVGVRGGDQGPGWHTDRHRRLQCTAHHQHPAPFQVHCQCARNVHDRCARLCLWWHRQVSPLFLLQHCAYLAHVQKCCLHQSGRTVCHLLHKNVLIRCFWKGYCFTKWSGFLIILLLATICMQKHLKNLNQAYLELLVQVVMIMEERKKVSDCVRNTACPSDIFWKGSSAIRSSNKEQKEWTFSHVSCAAYPRLSLLCTVWFAALTYAGIWLTVWCLHKSLCWQTHHAQAWLDVCYGERRVLWDGVWECWSHRQRQLWWCLLPVWSE